MISVKEMLAKYAGGSSKTWEHDRLSTVGASEVGQCLRKTWFSKNETAADEDYVDRFGAKLRGDLIERHFWLPGILSQLPEGVDLLFAGDDQRTLVSDYLSATPDGILVGLKDIEGECLVIEAKSIDPRVDLQKAKAEHAFQVQIQMGLIRRCTNLQPSYALITYIDASFLDDITEFLVPYDDKIFKAAWDRSMLIMRARKPEDLRPEGKLSGGKECEYCPFQNQCKGTTVGSIPTELVALSSDILAEAEAMARHAEQLGKAETEAKLAATQFDQDIKDFLRRNNTRMASGLGWSISWGQVKGRSSLDKESLAQACAEKGIDIDAYTKLGEPSDRLTVKFTGKGK